MGRAHAIVEGVFTPISFPLDFQQYAQETLDAWLGHNSAAVALLTGKPGDSAFAAVPAAARSVGWTFDHAEGAAGHRYFEWHDSAGNAIAFGFTDPGLASPPANRHGLAQQVVYSPHS